MSSWNQPCGAKCLGLRRVSVEPVMLLYMFASFLNYPTLQSLVYEKVCLQEFNSTFCLQLGNKTFALDHRGDEDIVQGVTSSWILKLNMAMAVPSFVIVLLVLGSWGDLVGRKLPVLLPCLGFVAMSLINVLNSVFFSAPLGFLLIGQVVNGVFGGYIAIMMAAYSYTADTSSMENRTHRVGIVESMTFLAGTLGVFLSGLLLDHTSYVFVFSFMAGLASLAALYTVFWLREVKPQVRPRDSGLCRLVADSLRLFGGCIARRRPERSKARIGLLLLMVAILMLCTLGEGDVTLLYVKRAPLSWSQSTYGYFKGLENFSRGLALVTLLPLAKKIFHLRDVTVVLLGLASKVVGLVVLGFAQRTWMVFLVIGVLQGFPSAGIRSLLSKLVQSEEQGRMFSLVACLENVAQILATLLFNELYPATLHLNAGFCFFFIAALSTLDIVLVLIVRSLSGSDEEFQATHDNTHIPTPEAEASFGNI